MYDLIGLGVSIVTLACLLGGFLLGRQQKSARAGAFPEVAITVGLAIAITGAIAVGAGGIAIAGAGVFCGAFLAGLGSGLFCRAH